MKDLRTEAENVRASMNREINKADSGNNSSMTMTNNNTGIAGAVTTVTGTVSHLCAFSSLELLIGRVYATMVH